MHRAHDQTGEQSNADTAGCNQGFCLATLALAQVGDEIILPLPYYFNHQMWFDMQGIRAVHLPFRPERGGVPDPEDAARLITERTRAIVLVTPNNPTGAVYQPEIIAALGGPQFSPIPETQFDNLYIVTVYRFGKAKVVQLKYGAPTP